MNYEIRFPLPAGLQKEICINENTPLVAFFEDGDLVIRDRDDDPESDDPIQHVPVTPCRGCEHFCPVHQVCKKGFHIEEEDFR